MSGLNGPIWMFSIVLGVVFLITGVNKALRYEQAKKIFRWVEDVPRPLTQAIGSAEILGALGLILPGTTRVYTWLTPVAAGALALLMLLAAIFHARRRERDALNLNVLLLLMLAFVAYGRWVLAPLT